MATFDIDTKESHDESLKDDENFSQQDEEPKRQKKSGLAYWVSEDHEPTTGKLDISDNCSESLPSADELRTFCCS